MLNLLYPFNLLENFMTPLRSLFTNPDQQGLTPINRVFLVIFGLLGFAVGFTLFFLSTQTDIFFAWTIKIPLSAAVLGAGYLSSILIAPMALQEKYWVRSQTSFIGFLPGLALIMLATFLHLDQFHFSNPQASPLAQLIAWLWVAGYLLITLVMGLLLFLQTRLTPPVPPQTIPLPLWLKILFFVVAAGALIPSAIFLFSPATLVPWWPWKITPLIARMLAAFLASQGCSALLALWANDCYKVKIMCAGYISFVSLQIIAFWRYPAELNWLSSGGVAYALLLTAILATGVAGVVMAQRANKQ